MVVLLLLIGGALPAQGIAQEPVPDRGEADAPNLESEFVASTIYQAGVFDVRLGHSPLFVDTRYYGVEIHDVGIAGVAWEFHLRHLRVLPGIGWAVGKENAPAPVGTARWVYEHPGWLSQGLWVQSFHEHVSEEEEGHSETVAGDGVGNTHSVVFEAHVSAVVRKVELGPLVEHVRYREEENEWKGGGRAAWRFGHGVKVSTEVLAPEVEARIGFVWER
jgi:hypothetical protein